MIKKLFFILFFLSLAGCKTMKHVKPRLTDAKLNMTFDFFPATSDPFRNLCRSGRLLCGVQLAAGDDRMAMYNNPDPPLEVPPRSTVQEILNMIVQRQPKYLWRVDNGVINLMPKPKYAPLQGGDNVLKRRISRLQFKKVSSYTAMRMICRKAGIKLPPTVLIGAPQIPGEITLDLQDITVQEAFNAVARADGQMLWHFAHTDKPGSYSLNMEFWRPFKIPNFDNEQFQ